MDLGAFSISLAVKDLEASRAFYEKFGFQAFAGNASQNWLIMKNGGHVIGLFQGMFEKNILTFNPGWDNNAQKLASFTDVRELQRQLKAQGVQLQQQADESTTGPASFVAVDPDGNPILVDQHVCNDNPDCFDGADRSRSTNPSQAVARTSRSSQPGSGSAGGMSCPRRAVGCACTVAGCAAARPSSTRPHPSEVGRTATAPASEHSDAVRGRRRVWTWARRVGLTLLVLVVLVFAVSGAYLGWDRLSPEQLDVAPPGFDVDAAGVRTHVEHWPAVRPSGKAPLVLVPGFAESTYVWSRVAPLLAADRDVYAYDVRGYGFTDRVPPYDLASDTDQLVGLIAALGLERPIVVGHSSGVAIALSLALRAPESVTGVVAANGDGTPYFGADRTSSGGGARWVLVDPIAPALVTAAMRHRAPIRSIVAAQCGPGCPVDDAAIDRWRAPFLLPGAVDALDEHPAAAAHRPHRRAGDDGRRPHRDPLRERGRQLHPGAGAGHRRAPAHLPDRGAPRRPPPGPARRTGPLRRGADPAARRPRPALSPAAPVGD